MFSSIRGLAIASIAAVWALGVSLSGASAITLPISQDSVITGSSARPDVFHQVAQYRSRPIWLHRHGVSRSGRIGNARQNRLWRTQYTRFRRDGRYSSTWYWRHRYLQNRRDRFRFHDGPRYRYWRHRTRFYPGPYWGAGPWWYDDDPPVIVVSPSYDRSAHVEWCLAHYRSYDPRTNTWVGYSGRVYQCDSPYDAR